MLDFIMWAAVFVLYPAATFPPLVESSSTWARVLRVILAAVLGLLMGYNLGRSAAAIF